MNRKYGYTRTSTPKQSIERQVRNILAVCPDCYIIKEVYTGTKIQGRKEFDKLLKMITAGDTIFFDSVSRMSRNAEEGIILYQELFEKNITLIFLKEPHINTETYRKALAVDIQMTGTNADILLQAVKEYLMALAKEQIRLAFEQAEKEVTDLHQRTKEGIETARLNGKQIGQKSGAHLITKKSIRVKEEIKKYNKAFGGSLSDAETMKLVGVSHNTFYKYKREIINDSN